MAFVTFFYLEETTNRQDIKFIATIPITLLGLIFAAWWAKDCRYLRPSAQNSRTSPKVSLSDLLAKAQANFGQAPRTISNADLQGYLNVPSPQWLLQQPDDKMHVFFDHLSSVFNDGKIVWGHVIQANSSLFEAGPNDAPGELVYSLQDRDDCHKILPLVARNLFSLKGTSPANPELAPIANYLTDQYIRVYGLPVPPCINPRLDCNISTAMFIRKHLPNNKLCRNLLPIVVREDTPMVAVPLPVRYWPDELVNWWTT